MDSGAEVSVISDQYVPCPPPDAPIVITECAYGHIQTLSVTKVEVQLLVRTIQVDAVISNRRSPDLLLGRKYEDFADLFAQTENMHQVSAVSTLRQQQLSDEENHAIDEQIQQGTEANPLLDILGEDYDFPQYNLSVLDPITQTFSYDDGDRQDLIHDQKTDQTLKDLWIAAETDNSEFQVINEVLQRQTTDQDGQQYTQIVLPVNRRQEVIRIAPMFAVPKKNCSIRLVVS